MRIDFSAVALRDDLADESTPALEWLFCQNVNDSDPAPATCRNNLNISRSQVICKSKRQLTRHAKSPNQTNLPDRYRRSPILSQSLHGGL